MMKHNFILSAANRGNQAYARRRTPCCGLSCGKASNPDDRHAGKLYQYFFTAGLNFLKGATIPLTTAVA
jgi:hypothetical protein